MMMDPNQPPAKLSSNLKVSLFTNSNILNCIEVCFCATQTNAIENEKQNVASTIDMMKVSANLVECFKPKTESNYCKK